MARKFKNQTKPTQDPTVEAAGPDLSKTLQDPTAEAAGPNITNSKDTPSADANKRKRTGTPSSAEPQNKKLSYADAFANAQPVGPDPKTKKTAHTLWVHTNNVEKGPISRDYFFEVVSRCNVIKVKGLLQGQSEFSWSYDMRGQPTYDSNLSRGKMICFDQQTFNFWRKYIPIAALNVGSVTYRACSWEEYKIPKIWYSCLIPFNTCKGLEVRDLIHATLVLKNLSMEGMLTCRTSYAKLSNQQICNIEVTDQLANAIDNAGKLLRGPVCSLSFKLQTGSAKDPEDETDNIEVDQNLDDVQMLEPESAVGSLPGGDSCSQFLDSSAETINQQKSPSNSV